MTSEAYVWIWLPQASEPILCGRIRADAPHYEFVYRKNYLSHKNAIPLDLRELPLAAKSFRPDVGELHNVLRDAAPDAWGRRVLLYRAKPPILSELDFLLLSRGDRIGALEFTEQPDSYKTPKSCPAKLEDLFRAAQTIEEGLSLPVELDNALLHASSVGGARPKALLEEPQAKWIAKFSSTTDPYPVVRAEHAAMWMAKKCGVEIPKICLTNVLRKDVLLVERFDRVQKKKEWSRRFMISSLTALQLHETEARLASYIDLAGFIRRFGKNFEQDSRELYQRMVFNILIGNTDDHARNHSFFWDGQTVQLCPAYDLSPILRTGHTVSQAMIVGKQGRLSTLQNALSETEQFGLTQKEAKTIQQKLRGTIEALWPQAADASKLTKKEADLFRQTTILSPGCFYK